MTPVKSIGAALPKAALDQDASKNSWLVVTKSAARDLIRG